MTTDDAGPALPRSPAPEDLRGARLRLRSRVLAEPQRLDLREELAAAYRREGHAAQAGRWSYLAAVRDPAEQAAFERAFEHDPVQLMAVLRWRGSEDEAATEVARERLRALRAVAEGSAGARLEWAAASRQASAPTTSDHLVEIGCATVLAVAGTCLVVGAVTIVRWVVGLLG